MEALLQRAHRLRQQAAEVKQLNEELKILRIEIDRLDIEEANHKLNLEQRRIENETLQKNIDLQKAIDENEKKNKEIIDTTVMKTSDNDRMIKAKEMLDFGKALTGIRWNYSTPDNIIAGYISNKEKGVLNAFEYDINKENIQNELWKQIEIASSADWNDMYKLHIEKNIKCDKENIPINK